MELYQGEIYKDDRLFILDLVQTRKGNELVWSVITRRNQDSFPPFRSDEFTTKEEAIEFIKSIEPTTPLISLEGKAPGSQLSYEQYCNKLKDIGVPSAIEIYNMNRTTQREIIISDIEDSELNT
jgi:hypothetical protein